MSSEDFTHQDFLAVNRRLPEDYAPYGENDRNAEGATWTADCSSGCRFAAWVYGDWLVCTNPQSHRAGLLTFEHQGCPQFKSEEALWPTRA